MTEVRRSKGSVFVQTWEIEGDLTEHDELLVHWLDYVRRSYPVMGMRYFHPVHASKNMRSWAVYLDSRESLKGYLRFLREDEECQRYRSLWLERLRYTSYSVTVKHGLLDMSGFEQPI